MRNDSAAGWSSTTVAPGSSSQDTPGGGEQGRSVDGEDRGDPIHARGEAGRGIRRAGERIVELARPAGVVEVVVAEIRRTEQLFPDRVAAIGDRGTGDQSEGDGNRQQRHDEKLQRTHGTHVA